MGALSNQIELKNSGGIGNSKQGIQLELTPTLAENIVVIIDFLIFPENILLVVDFDGITSDVIAENKIAILAPSEAHGKVISKINISISSGEDYHLEAQVLPNS